MKFANRMELVKASGIRFVQKKIASKDGVISFAAGLPDGDLFPLDELTELTNQLMKEKGKTALQYGMTQGYRPLLEKLALRMKEKENITCTVENLIITTGSQQGLGMSAMAFVNEGDIVLAENPSYLGGINACRPYGCSFLGVDTDDNGIVIEDLKNKLAANPQIHMIYVIPSFQNPTGKAWSLERRKQFMEAIEPYDLVVVEDNPYGEICFTNNEFPTLKSMDKQGKVIYLGSFSKILCPGLRVAWVCAEKEIIEKMELLKQGIDLQCNEMAQMQVLAYLENCDVEAHIQQIKAAYQHRCGLMLEELEKQMPSYVKYTKPEGGMFIWAELPETMDATEMLDTAVDAGVAYVPGEYFYATDEEAKKNTMRLNYTIMKDEQIIEGVKRLAEVIKTVYKN
jgi:2-aminoadipate transaminase